MTWLRVDDGFTANGKIAQLTDAEFRVWMRLLCYCSRVKDPTVDRATRGEVAGLTLPRIRTYLDLELLDQSGSDYEVHDWAQFLPADATNADRQARWRARRNGTRNGERNAEVTAPTVTRNASKPLRDPHAQAQTRTRGPSRPVDQDHRTVTETVNENTPRTPSDGRDETNGSGHGHGGGGLKEVGTTIKTHLAAIAPTHDDDLPF